ncbi:MAG: GNAT family N-acetyltransferase [Candidatus Acidiferrales bacterium]
MRIENADVPDFIDIVRKLFREYEAHIKVDLCFQGFEKELAGLPGEYARPSGRLLLAFDGDVVAGCGALRRVEDKVCEMKRLYVRAEHQGKSIGAALARVLIEQASEAGYAWMRLDTMPSMQKAIALYRSIGFKEISAYRFNPVPGALFLELELAEAHFARKS